jgi:hypothetical protein
MLRTIVLAGCGVALAGPALGQARQVPVPKPDPQVQARYQLAIMADVLERAVQQGARLMSQQLQGGMPQMFLIDGGARARGFRLDGFGVFFDVDVPAMRQSVMWSWRMLDLTGGGPAGALDELKAHLKTVTDPAQRKALDQAIRQIELQIAPAPGAADTVRADNVLPREGQPTVVVAPGAPGGQPGGTRIVSQVLRPASEQDAGDAYTLAVKDALVDAMLRYSQSLAVGADDWLVVAARDRGGPGIGADDPFEVTTIQLRIKGGDLQAFHAGRLTFDEAQARAKVFLILASLWG